MSATAEILILLGELPTEVASVEEFDDEDTPGLTITLEPRREDDRVMRVLILTMPNGTYQAHRSFTDSMTTKSVDGIAPADLSATVRGLLS